MKCEICDKEIPVGENYYDLDDNGHIFCSCECATDYLIYCCRLSIETNTGKCDGE